MTQKPKRHYVNNKDFYDALVTYRKKLSENSNTRVPDYVGQCIMAICTKLSTKPNFIGYSFRDEMISDAIENCIASVDGFDPAKSSNPFAYFTQIAWNAFIRRISKEKKQQYIKHKNMVNNIAVADLEPEAFSASTTKTQYNEITNEIIDSFEKKLTKPKKNSIVGVEKFVTEEVATDDTKTPSTTSSN